MPRYRTNKQIVDAIIDDICNRRGLRQVWEGMDEETKREIRDTWLKLFSKRNRTSD